MVSLYIEEPQLSSEDQMIELEYPNFFLPQMQSQHSAATPSDHGLHRNNQPDNVPPDGNMTLFTEFSCQNIEPEGRG